MTDPSANRKIHLALGIQSGLKAVDYYPRLRPRAIVSCFQALLNPSSQIDFTVALVISHYLYTVSDPVDVMARISKNTLVYYET